MGLHIESAARAEALAALMGRGNDLMDRGEAAEAVKAYCELITAVPQFGPAYRNLALALEQDGKLAEALSACRRAVALQPNDLEAYLVMARLLIRLERIDQAVSMYELAALAAPGRSAVH